MRAKIKKLFRNRRCNAEAAGGVLTIDHQQIDGVRFKDVGEMFTDDVAAGRAKDVADEKNVHL